MAKRLLAVLLCLAMVFVLLPTFAVAEPAHAHGGQSYTAHSSKNSLPTASGFYYLEEDVELPESFNTYGQSYSGKTVTICLNGHTLSRKGTGRIFNVTGTSNLTICDCTGNGVITGGNMSGNGGAANVATGGRLTISDVKISGNQGTAAGALSTQGTLTLTNVVLTNNTNTAAGGSAVYAAAGANVTMTDCTVTGNNSKPASANYNGAVYVTNGNAKLTVAGSTVIDGNTICNGTASGNLLLQDAGTKLYVGALASDANISVTTEAKKFGTATAASDFLVLAEGTDKAALESAWTNALISYANTDQKVVYTAENGFTFAKITAPEEGHANTAGYDKCNHGTVSWTGVSTMAEINQVASGYYYLKNDIDMGAVRLTVKNDVVICLNGYTLDRNATAGGYARAIHINAGAKLTICDCTAHVKDGVYTAGTITGGWAVQGSGAYVAGTLELYDGIFTGNKTEDYNGTKAQGTIAVLKDGAFRMYGGEISGNTSTDGAGVHMLNPAAEFTMNGGSIKNNTAGGLGGGVYLAGTNAVIGGDAVITGNTAGGKTSNVYMPAGTNFKAQNLTEKAAIGFLLEKEPGTVASAGVKAANLTCFTNDNPSSIYTPMLKGSRLVLDTPRTGDSHPVPGYEKCGHGDSSVIWEAWGDEDAELATLPTTSGHYYLSEDIILSGTVTTEAGQNVVLCLNGYSVTGGGILLQVEMDAVYTVCDCVETGTMTGSPAVRVKGEGGKFVLEDGYITGCSTTGNATNTGAVHVEYGTFTMTGGYVTGNEIRGVYVGSGATFEMKGGELSDNISATNGGGVRINGGAMTMTGGTITGNVTTGTAGGSAIAVQSGSAEITGGTITGNECGSGGTIYSAGTLTITGVTIAGNTTRSNGGALYIQSGKATLTNVTLKNNQSTESMGGGLFVAGGTVTVNGGEITGNSAVIGGGVRINAGSLTLNDVKITGNTATSNGGGVHCKNPEAVLTLGGKTVITDNTVAGATSNLQMDSGVTVRLDSVNYPLTEGAKICLSANLSDIVTGVLVATGADQSGAAAYFVNDQGQAVTAKGTELWLTLKAGAEHKSHEKDECGHTDVQWKPWVGGSMSSGHYYLIGDVEMTQTVNVTEGEITVCLNGFDLIRTASATPDFDRIFRVSGGTLTICDCKGGGHITGGTACQGSAIFINGAGAEVNLYGGIISGNISKDSANDPNTNSLGTVCVINGTFNMYDGEISDNTSVRGSAITIYKNGAVFTLHDGKICNNKSTGTGDTDGGAIHQLGGEVYLLGGQISGNSGNYGGAVRANRAVLVIDGTKITNNTAKLDGGGIYALRTKVTMKSGSVSNNSAKNAGGMNLGTDCEVILSGGEISGNYAAKHGGGLLTSGTNPNVKLSGVIISFNTAGDRGGGILADKGTVTMTDGVISGNTAKYGGAIRGAKSTVNIYGGIIKNNKADDGGALYTIDTTMDIQNITFSGNEAAIIGGCMAFGSRSRITMKNVTVDGNKSVNYGGGIMLQGTDPKLTMTGCTVKNNTTDVYGGGIAVYRGTFIGKDVTITGNLANYGGGFYTGRATEVKLTNYNITGNTANADGGGLYLLRTPVTLDTGSINANTAGANGGGMATGSEAVVKIIGDTSISQNTAGTNGGGIMLQGTAPQLYVGDGTHQVKITDNTVGGSGGAIRGGVNGNVFGILDMNNVLISGNRSQASEPGASGSAVYYSRRVRSVFENVTIENNHGAGNGGGIALQYLSEVTLKNCAVTGNSSIGNGGGLYLGTLCQINLDNSSVSGNTTIGRGGGAMIQPSGTLTMRDSALQENTAGIGGGAYVERAGNLDAVDSVIVSNTATRQASAIYGEGSIYLQNVDISGNTDQAGGCAVYLDGSGGDGESYLPDVCQFKGKITIADNVGGEMMFTNDACVSIYGTGLAEGSRILVDNPDGGITRWICGPYDYVREGDRYTITPGTRSLSEADPVTVVEEPVEEPTEAPTEEIVEQPAKSTNLSVILIAVGVLLVVAVCAVIVVLVAKKKNKK